MIRTTITPQQADISISIPPQYIGKKLEVLLYAVDEITEEEVNPGVMAQFWGVLSDESAQALQAQTTKDRAEWDRNI